MSHPEIANVVEDTDQSIEKAMAALLNDAKTNANEIPKDLRLLPHGNNEVRANLIRRASLLWSNAKWLEDDLKAHADTVKNMLHIWEQYNDCQAGGKFVPFCRVSYTMVDAGAVDPQPLNPRCIVGTYKGTRIVTVRDVEEFHSNQGRAGGLIDSITKRYVIPSILDGQPIGAAARQPLPLVSDDKVMIIHKLEQLHGQQLTNHFRAALFPGSAPEPTPTTPTRNVRRRGGADADVSEASRGAAREA